MLNISYGIDSIRRIIAPSLCRGGGGRQGRETVQVSHRSANSSFKHFLAEFGRSVCTSSIPVAFLSNEKGEMLQKIHLPKKIYSGTVAMLE